MPLPSDGKNKSITHSGYRLPGVDALDTFPLFLPSARRMYRRISGVGSLTRKWVMNWSWTQSTDFDRDWSCCWSRFVSSASPASFAKMCVRDWGNVELRETKQEKICTRNHITIVITHLDMRLPLLSGDRASTASSDDPRNTLFINGRLTAHDARHGPAVKGARRLECGRWLC